MSSHGHHDVFAKLAIDETAEFSRAITAALAKVNIEETLIVVTAGEVLYILTNLFVLRDPF